ncbi:amino acid adenylation domain-containing protein [Streptomyces sp. NPDC051976]|uniref:non-ribosomal peptide synthetase n=1 Tax=Streptomyces sp. NPDC051976 TaxID=3154947 RepID=UPI0034440F73
MTGNLKESPADAVRALLAARATAALSGDAVATGGSRIPRRPDRRDPAPLSTGQRRLWFAAQLEPNGAANVPLVLRLTGALDTAAVRGAVEDVIARHDVLGSVFRDGEDGPVAVPADVAPDFAVLEVAGTDLDAALHAEATAPFDLAARPPIRVRLFRLGAADHVLSVTVHHVATDAHSEALLLGELAAAYAHRTGSGAPLPAAQAAQYADFAAWQAERLAGTAADQDLQWWVRRLGDAPPLLELPTDRRRPSVARWDADQVPVRVPAAAAAALRAAAADAGCTPFMAVLAAWQVLLGRLTAVDDVVVGVPHSGRHHTDVADTVGFFVNTLPMRGDLSGDPRVCDLLSRTRGDVLDAYSHAETPFERMVERLRPERSLAGTPVVQVMLNLLEDDGSSRALRFGDAEAVPVDLPSLVAQADLVLDLRAEADGYTGELIFRTDLFEADTVAAWARCFERLAEEFGGDPERRVSELDLLGPAADALLRLGAGTELPAGPATVLDAVLTRAADRAELTAVSAAIAAQLVSAGVRPGDAVGVCLTRDQRLPAALLAVWRAGAAYVPLDADHPAQWLGRLAERAGVRVVLADEGTAAAASAIDGTRLVVADPAAPPGALPAAPCAGDLAYVLFTSGSTGEPKGVEVTHATLAALASAMRADLGVGPSDVMLAVAPLSFDISASEIWTTLAAGGRCVVVERECALDGHALARRIADTGATSVNLTPTSFRMLLAAGWQGDGKLRALSGGEALDAALAGELLGHVGELWNMYGPTETTVTATAHRVRPADTDASGAPTVPLGGAIAGTRLYVVDAAGRLAPPGAVGELWIGGAGVALGYRNRPDLTSAAFTADPFRPGGRCFRTADAVRWRADGLLEFVGRRDQQVKIRGHRIEPSDIEAALHQCPGVRAAAVAVAGSGPDTRLVGFVAPDTVATDTVEAFLAARLPRHMVPRRWVLLPALPTLPSGKVDRGALADPGGGERPFVPPATGMEEFVAEMWAETIGAARDLPIGRDDDFFALGGHSLAATRVVGRLLESLECEVPVRVLFEHPTLAEFAAAVERLVLAGLAAALEEEVTS